MSSQLVSHSLVWHEFIVPGLDPALPSFNLVQDPGYRMAKCGDYSY